MRLGKFLATAGVASRRASEEIIRAARVTVNGTTITDPATNVTGADDVRVDGSRIAPSAHREVYLVNKPRGVVSTASDPQGRRTVVSLVPTSARLYPVGRLDIDTTGVILLTDDGDLAHRLTHPSFEVPRTYRAQVRNPPIADRTLRRLRDGIQLDDGPTAPARVRRLGGRDTNMLELTLHEGRNRQVKRMCEAVGHPVIRLERVAFGPLELKGLPLGAYRRLSDAEVTQLQLGLTPAGRSARRGAAGSSAARRPPARA